MAELNITKGPWKASYLESGNDVQNGLAGWTVQANEGIAYNIAREANARAIAEVPEFIKLVKAIHFYEKDGLNRWDWIQGEVNKIILDLGLDA